MIDPLMLLGGVALAAIVLLPAIGQATATASQLQPRVKELERASNGMGFIAGACLLLISGVGWQYQPARPYFFGLGVLFMIWGIFFVRVGLSRLAHTPRDSTLIMGSIIYLVFGAAFLYVFAQHWLGAYGDYVMLLLGVFFVVSGIFRITLNRDRTSDNPAEEIRIKIEHDTGYGHAGFDDDDPPPRRR